MLGFMQDTDKTTLDRTDKTLSLWGLPSYGEPLNEVSGQEAS